MTSQDSKQEQADIFRYARFTPFSYAVALIGLGLLILWVAIDATESELLSTVVILLIAIFLLVTGARLMWRVQDRIVLTEAGITQTTLFEKIEIPWHEVLLIARYSSEFDGPGIRVFSENREQITILKHIEDYQRLCEALTKRVAPERITFLHDDGADRRSALSRLLHALRHAWHILRNVLRGYLTGQPPDDERPRKGCC